MSKFKKKYVVKAVNGYGVEISSVKPVVVTGETEEIALEKALNKNPELKKIFDNEPNENSSKCEIMNGNYVIIVPYDYYRG